MPLIYKFSISFILDVNALETLERREKRSTEERK
jgi:hypothetical protein